MTKQPYNEAQFETWRNKYIKTTDDLTKWMKSINPYNIEHQLPHVESNEKLREYFALTEMTILTKYKLLTDEGIPRIKTEYVQKLNAMLTKMET